MPYVNIRLLEGANLEQKQQLVREITDTLVRVLGKDPAKTHITIDELSPENWGFMGDLVSEQRKKSGS